MASRGWRLRSCGGVDGLWDVVQLSFMRGSTMLRPNAAVSSGSASDPDKGNSPGYGPEHAVMVGGDGVWGGRPDKDGSMFLGALFAQPELLDCIILNEQGSDHTTECAHLERLVGGDEWEIVTSAYELKGGSESIICAPWVPKESKHAKTATAQEDEDRQKELQAMQEKSNADTTVVLYSEKGCKGEKFILTTDTTYLCGATGLKFLISKRQITIGNSAKSMQVVGAGEVDLMSDCGAKQYWATVMPLDGCTEMYTWPATNALRIQHTSSLSVVQQPSVATSSARSVSQSEPPEDENKRKFRVVYSSESSEYHAFQTQASLYSFMDSKQGDFGGMWTRLLTSSEPDDLVDTFPTFYGKRHPYSKRYSPLNKADTTQKWYASVNAPGDDEVIVMIDPDNWLLKPIHEHVAEVTIGHAVAEAAWFSGQPQLVRELWMEFGGGAGARLDLAAVPYFVHSQDLKKIAPLWKEWVLKLRYGLEESKTMSSKYRALQIDWCVEMYAYVFAAADLKIAHTIKTRLQLRDVDGQPTEDQKKTILMLHTGRAWFPNDWAPAARWHHSEGAAWAYRGKQVWCKCNFTASRVVPWPVPPGADWVSQHTLRILHDAQEYFGPMPDSKFRKYGSHQRYAEGYP